MDINEIVMKIHQGTRLSRSELEITLDGTKLNCILKNAHFTRHTFFPLPQNDSEIARIISQLTLENKYQTNAKRLNDIQE